MWGQARKARKPTRRDQYLWVIPLLPCNRHAMLQFTYAKLGDGVDSVKLVSACARMRVCVCARVCVCVHAPWPVRARLCVCAPWPTTVVYGGFGAMAPGAVYCTNWIASPHTRPPRGACGHRKLARSRARPNEPFCGFALRCLALGPAPAPQPERQEGVWQGTPHPARPAGAPRRWWCATRQVRTRSILQRSAAQEHPGWIRGMGARTAAGCTGVACLVAPGKGPARGGAWVRQSAPSQAKESTRSEHEFIRLAFPVLAVFVVLTTVHFRFLPCLALFVPRVDLLEEESSGDGGLYDQEFLAAAEEGKELLAELTKAVRQGTTRVFSEWAGSLGSRPRPRTPTLWARVRVWVRGRRCTQTTGLSLTDVSATRQTLRGCVAVLLRRCVAKLLQGACAITGEVRSEVQALLKGVQQYCPQ